MAEVAQKSCVLVGTVKDEGPYLLEWLAYYKVIGFSKAMIFYNDCTDYTDDMLRALQRRTDFVLTANNDKKVSGTHHDPQRRAYILARDVPQVAEASYVFVADADEFLNIKAGNGHLNDLFQSMGPFHAISFTWRLFGTNGQEAITGNPVLQDFTSARAEIPPKMVRLWGVKTMFSPTNVVKFGIHRPYHTRDIRDGKTPVIWLNGSGQRMPDKFRDTGWRVNRDSHGNAVAELNHYATRSVDGFLFKQLRGAANAGGYDRLNLEYYHAFNTNDVEETLITRHIPAVQDQIRRWKNTIPGLAQMHDESLALHRESVQLRKQAMREFDQAALAELGSS